MEGIEVVFKGAKREEATMITVFQCHQRRTGASRQLENETTVLWLQTTGLPVRMVCEVPTLPIFGTFASLRTGA